MSREINTDDYAWGYDQGLRDGREDGYLDGWHNCAKVYESRLADLAMELVTLNARLAVLERRI